MLIDQENMIKMIYTGQSMNPLFSTGDILYIIPYGETKISNDDIIVFRSPNDKTFITHRVVSILPYGIITKGDNSEYVDNWKLNPNDIIGKVIFIQRNGKLKKTFRGFGNKPYVEIIRRYNYFKRRVLSILSPVYHSLSNKAIYSLQDKKPSFLKQININRADGIEKQILLGKYLIGRLRPKCTKWEIKKPFRILLNPEKYSKRRSY